MRVFALSDIHVDYEENFRFVNYLSEADYQQDLLILAGDISSDIQLFEKTLRILKKRFWEVMFIPGNHDLWVKQNDIKDSLEKLQLITDVIHDCGIRMEPLSFPSMVIIPLYAWYDYSFESPSPEIMKTWTDNKACKWPEGFDEQSITQYFLAMNEPFLHNHTLKQAITFSHFLPRIDIMPFFIPSNNLNSVLGTSLLEKQIRKVGSRIHVYGHSHVNNHVMKDNTLYINNAFGYPYETFITAKKLNCIVEI